MERSGDAAGRNVIIKSIRALAEAQTLKSAGGVLLAVDADQKIRYERIQQRRSESDQVSFDEFQKHEQLEMDDPDPHGMQKAKIIEMADYVLQNNKSFEDLYAQVDRALEKVS